MKMIYFWYIGTAVFLISFRTAFAPLFWAAALAFLMDPVVSGIQKRIFFRNETAKRAIAVVVLMSLLISGILLVGMGILPQLRESVRALLARLPQYWEALIAMTGRYPLLAKLLPDEYTVSERLSRLQSSLLSGAWHLTRGLSSAVAGSLSVTLTTTILCLYFLFCKQSFLDRISPFRTLLPPALLRIANRVLQTAREVFTAYLGSRVIESLFLFLCCFPGLLLCRIPHALFFAVLVSLGNLVPILGSIVSSAFCTLLLLAIEPAKALWFLLFFFALQQLDNQLIYPRIAGNRLGLPAVCSVTAVLIGARIGGAVGAFLSVPILALCWRLAEDAAEKPRNIA